MVDIIIYTKPETLLHKQGKLENDPDKYHFNEYYWKFNRVPKKINHNSRIYFATEGFIRGYFKLFDMSCDEIEWDCRTWKDIKPIPCKHFQGFKYADKAEGLK